MYEHIAIFGPWAQRLGPCAALAPRAMLWPLATRIMLCYGPLGHALLCSVLLISASKCLSLPNTCIPVHLYTYTPVHLYT